MHLGDLAPHLVRDRPVRRMTLASGPELDQVEGLARVELEDVADSVGQGQRVRRLCQEPNPAEPLILGAGYVERALVLAPESCAHELFREVRSEIRREALPLTCEQAVSL